MTKVLFICVVVIVALGSIIWFLNKKLSAIKEQFDQFKKTTPTVEVRNGEAIIKTPAGEELGEYKVKKK